MNLILDLKFILPEIILTAAAIFTLLFDLSIKDKRLIAYFVLSALAVALLYLTRIPAINLNLFSGMIVSDAIALFFRILSVAIAIVVILISFDYKEISAEYRQEFYCLMLLVTCAMMLLSASNNLLMIYLGIEFLGLISYIIAAYWRGNLKSSEAGLKYFLIGTASSITMLYGISLLYGLTGSLDLTTINAILSQGNFSPAMISVVILTILIGLGLKIAMVPVHFWCPDVYEGAPTPVTAFFSVGPKIAGFVVLLRFLFVGSSFFSLHWAHLLAIISVATMIVGNVTALPQTNIKRLLAYSSIAHAGYAMVGLVVGKEIGQISLFIYLLTYVIMNLGAFAAVIAISNKLKSDEIKDYAGLSVNSPYLSALLALFLLSLAGIPPLAGFIGKFYIFSASLKEGHLDLAIAVALNSVIAAFYYFNIIRTMYLLPAQTRAQIKPSPSLNLALVVTLIFILAFGLYPKPLIDFATNSLSLFTP